jgi:3-oxoacyl-[acyl-carrier-protein] synthase-3
MPDIHIRAVGTYLPGPPVDNATLVRRFAMTPQAEQWIDTFIGTRTRHFCVDLDTGDVLYSMADMGEVAGRRALADAGLEPADIDVMVLATSTPDQLMPATVNQVADRLGINDVPTYQLQSGCTGALQAMSVAFHLLRAGAARTALVIGAETIAKHFDLATAVSSMSRGEQVSGVMFGDGAGALVLSTEPGPAPVPVLRSVMQRLVGLGRAPGHTMEWFGAADRHLDLRPTNEDYKAIEESVPVLAVEVLDELVEQQGWARDDLDFLLPPQLSGTMTARIAQRLDVPGAQEVSCVTETGNTGNALPFFQLERLLPKLSSGNRAVGIAVESSKWIKAGYAVEMP